MITLMLDLAKMVAICPKRTFGADIIHVRFGAQMQTSRLLIDDPQSAKLAWPFSSL
jgi:hypothetical protein